MSFPVPTAHQIYPYFFQLGGRMYPISIRDQMVRSQMLVEQALEAGLIGGPDDRPLLVVGAGAAGATAAMCAAAFRVRTLLVDEGPAPFRLQAGCRTRWLDPAHYDWPVAHWHTQRYPWSGGPVSPRTPLPWASDFSDRVAAGWWMRVRRAVQQQPWLRIAFHTVARPAKANRPAAGGWTMDFTTGTRSWRGNFGMVVWTVGFGVETCVVPQSSHCNHPAHPYVGYPFWSTDPFEQANYGLPQAIQPQIVISGAGDGGLQDFLRVTTACRSARELFYYCNLPRALGRHLLSFEERAQRAFHWGDKMATRWGGYDHAVLQTIHEEHRRLARKYASRKSVKEGLAKVIRTALPQIQLVHDCTHFPNVYPLNRFLALLIAAHLQIPDLIIAGKRTLEVNGEVGHQCQAQFAACHGQPHQVLLANALYCLAPTPAAAAITRRLDANIVIIRHGIDARRLTAPQLPDIPLTRQLPPFHVHG